MDNFTIYCTQEQAKKALELGAPIKANKDYSNGNLSETLCVYGDIINKDKWGIGECTILHIPTAEQMRGWLMERLGATTFTNKHYSCCDREGYGYLIIGRDVILEVDAVDNGRYLLDSDKEATIAAIDAALDYLIPYKDDK